MTPEEIDALIESNCKPAIALLHTPWQNPRADLARATTLISQRSALKAFFKERFDGR